MGTGQRTRAFVLAAGFLKLVDVVDVVVDGASCSLSATQRATFTDAVTMPLFLQDSFDFNVEISVSWGARR